MSLQAGIDLAQAGEGLARKKTAFGQTGIEDGRRMAFGEDETVAVGQSGVLRIDVHFAKIKGCQDFDRGQRAARVARSGAADHLDDHDPDLARDFA